MAFDSAAFLFFFLPLLLILEALARGERAKNVLLCLAGLIFYAFGELWALALLIASALVNWLLGLLAMGGKKYAAALAAVINLALLGACKYLGFFGSGLALLGVELSLPEILAPAGVSFFTFKGIQLRLRRRAAPAGGDAKLFRGALLHLLPAGGDERPALALFAFRAQLARRERSWERTAQGARRFILGLGKKLLLSGAAAVIADAAFTAGDALTAPLAWLGAAAYSLQLYLDFSGYSDMAVGLGAMLGFALPGKLQLPLRRHLHHGLLAALAHLALALVPRLPLHPPRRQPARQMAHGGQQGRGVRPLRALARGQHDLRPLGRVARAALRAGEPEGAGRGALAQNGRRARALARLRPAGRLAGLRHVPRAGRGLRLRLSGRHVHALGTARGGAAAARALGGRLYAGAARAGRAHLPARAAALRRRLSSPEGALRPAADAAGYALSLVLLVLCASAIASGGFAPFIYFQF